MTSIVGTIDGKDVLLGADSAAASVADQHEIYTVNEPKLFTTGPYVMGVCGSYRVGQVLRHDEAPLPAPPADGPLDHFLVQKLIPAITLRLFDAAVYGTQRSYLGENVALLLGVRGELWHIGPDCTVLPEGNYGAIGSGRLRSYAALHALTSAGVMDARGRLTLALDATAAYTATVRPPWQFIRGGAA